MREVVRYVLIPAIVGGLVGLLVMFANNGSVSQKPGYSAAVKRAGPSVVNIYSTQFVGRPPICQLERFREWCNAIAGESPQRMPGSLGSGVVVRADGYILTNYHVIEQADEILVAFNNGQATTAQLIGQDPLTDLAVIKVQAQGLSVISMGSSDSAEVGDVALAIGNPFGIGQTVSLGIISAIGRTGISRSRYYDYIQTDAAINPGNSGGALIDTEGNLIGINSMIFSRSGGSMGIGFAIPSELAMSILDEIVTTGRVVRGYLGVDLAPNPPTGALAGLTVDNVRSNSPAQQAGIRRGDLIVSINGQPSVSSTSVVRQLAKSSPGDVLNLEILRNGVPLALTARSGERPPGR